MANFRFQLTLLLLAGVCVCVISTPAIPLFVRTPYLSTWLQSPSKQLAGNWATFWNGQIKGFSGLAHVDGKTYQMMGAAVQGGHLGNIPNAQQVDLKVTPTQSIFRLHAGPVEVSLIFFTPLDPTDLLRLSLPASYLAVNARSLDANKHSVQLYFDITAEWMSGKGDANVIWNLNKLVNGSSAIYNFDIQLNDPRPFTEEAELSQWGQVKFGTDASNTVTYQAGKDLDVRGEFVAKGHLTNTIDRHYRAVATNWPVFGFARDLGQVGPTATPTAFYAVARVRSPAISYSTGYLKSLWEDYFDANSDHMMAFVVADREKAYERAQALDHKIISDARSEGESYVKIVSYALRQAFGGTEMVGSKQQPWMMLKEISSDGNCQTVDVIYPHFPIHYYLNPTLIKYLLDPLFHNAETRGLWPQAYAMHDLGSNYPRCVGHLDGREESMEVEETANMIIMTAAYVKASGDSGYAKRHYAQLKQWGKFLVEKGLIVGDQLTTDDFLGRLKNSTNLSVKAIIGLEAMAQLANATGEHSDAQHYANTSRSYISRWQQYAVDRTGKHVKMSYNVQDSWFLLYNIYFDKLLQTNVVPSNIFAMQDAFYPTVMNKYGIPLISTKTETKIDWEMLAAAASNNHHLATQIYDRLAHWIEHTNSNVPLSDFYDTKTGNSPMFINRPVVGSLFGALALKRNL